MRSTVALLASALFAVFIPAHGTQVFVDRHDPHENPQITRYHTKALPKALLGNVTKFAALRGFGVDGTTGNVTGYKEALDLYTKTFPLADVIWPSYGFLYGHNLPDVLREIASRGIIVTDIWDYVPGDKDSCSSSGEVCEFKIDPGMYGALESLLGDLFTGMDVGEQDGRYIGQYAHQGLPSRPRTEQYLAFSRHFDRMARDLGDRLTALTSLYMPHYLMKTGLYTMVASETAQGLPNAQLFMAFNRGAAKQYGVWWWSNVSVYNRFGYKSYPDHPTGGTSLSLMKRLMYSQIMYNSAFVSFESGWTESTARALPRHSPLFNTAPLGQQSLGDTVLSPIGRIQASARQWATRNAASIGTYAATVAVVLDFFGGFNPPRHLYTDELFRVWGALPYDPTDHYANALLDAFYPGYADSSYFHNERGFQSPTPFGDIVDVLLTDAPAWLLRRYPVVVLAGAVGPEMSQQEIADKLRDFLSSGGTALVTAAQIAALPLSFQGLTANLKNCTDYAAGTVVSGDFGRITEPQSFRVCACTVPSQARVLARIGSTAVAWAVPVAGGTLVLTAAPFPIFTTTSARLPIVSVVDAPLPTPYPLLAHFHAILQSVLESEAMVISAAPGLTFSVNVVDPASVTVAVFNPDYAQKDLYINATSGDMACNEIPIPDVESNATGYLPMGSEGADLGKDTATTIAGGSLRIFSCALKTAVTPIPHTPLPPRPRNRGLFLASGPLENEILRRPTFFDHYDTAVVDWRTVGGLDVAGPAFAAASRTIALQNLSFFVDLTSGVNLYPDMRLVLNARDDYDTSRALILRVIERTAALGGKGVVLTLHEFPENWYTPQQSIADMEASLADICDQAASRGLVVMLRLAANKYPDSFLTAVALRSSLKKSNLKLAVSTGLLLPAGPAQLEAAAGAIGMFYVGCATTDPLTAQRTSAAAPLAGCDPGSLKLIKSYLAAQPNALVVPEAASVTLDDEYAEIRVIETL